MSPLSASKLFIRAPYPTAARLAFGFALFLVAIVALYAGVAINRSCAGVEWTHNLWIHNLKTLPQQISIMWFVWVPLGVIVAMLFAVITRTVRRSTLITAIGITALFEMFALITAVLGSGGCPVPNF